MKNQETKNRRIIYLYDDSNIVIEFTLWDDVADSFQGKKDELIAIKSTRIGEFMSKKTLSNSFSTKIFLDLNQVPKDQRITQLRNWRNNEFDENQLQIQTSEASAGGGKFIPMCIEEVNVDTQFVTEKGLYQTRAHISHVRTDGNLYYPACPGCGKKSNDISGDGTSWQCPSCNNQHQQPNFRYTLTLKLTDQSGSLWASAFDKIGISVIGKDAKTIKDMKDQGDEAGVTDLFKEAHNKEYTMKIVSKQDTYGKETRMKHQIVTINPVNYLTESRELLRGLEEYATKQ
jgi:replication factor A1